MIPPSEPEAQVREPAASKPLLTEINSPEVPSCPLCDGIAEEWLRKNGHVLLECVNCGHRFVDISEASGHVARVYGDDYFNGAIGGYPDYLADGDLLVAHGKRYASILNRHMEPGTILDIGAAAGFILKGFEEMGWSATGLEPNSSMAAVAHRNLGAAIETNTLEENSLGIQYDLITMIQVAAHFLDPREAFTAAQQLTKPGGYWLIESWDRNSWTAKILGKAWHEYNPPSVLHWFTVDSLKEIVQNLGLREIARGRPTKWISKSYARSIYEGQPEQQSGPGKLLFQGLRLIPRNFPIPYLLDDIFWVLYQKPKLSV